MNAVYEYSYNENGIGAFTTYTYVKIVEAYDYLWYTEYKEINKIKVSVFSGKLMKTNDKGFLRLIRNHAKVKSGVIIWKDLVIKGSETLDLIESASGRELKSIKLNSDLFIAIEKEALSNE